MRKTPRDENDERLGIFSEANFYSWEVRGE